VIGDMVVNLVHSSKAEAKPDHLIREKKKGHRRFPNPPVGVVGTSSAQAEERLFFASDW
jgi:hypothetical protein